MLGSGLPSARVSISTAPVVGRLSGPPPSAKTTNNPSFVKAVCECRHIRTQDHHPSYAVESMTSRKLANCVSNQGICSDTESRNRDCFETSTSNAHPGSTFSSGVMTRANPPRYRHRRLEGFAIQSRVHRTQRSSYIIAAGGVAASARGYVSARVSHSSAAARGEERQPLVQAIRTPKWPARPGGICA